MAPAGEVQPHPVLSEHYASEAEKPAFVRALFDAGAPFYDRVAGFGFFGTGKAYRRAAQRRAGVGAGMKLLDCAAGTGLMTGAAIRLGVRPSDIVCLDPSPGMLRFASGNYGVETVVASADAIPLADERFDFVVMGYALRHVASLEGTFAEFLRVLRPGGGLLVLEITAPSHPAGRRAFRFGFRTLYPAIARLITGSRAAADMMRYYWETMDASARPDAILGAMQAAGFGRVERRIFGSVFSEYTARRPA